MKQQSAMAAPTSEATGPDTNACSKDGLSGNVVSRAQGQAGNAAAQEALATVAPTPNALGRGAGLPQTKDEALQRHAAGVRRVRSLLDAALAQEIDPAGSVTSRQNLLHNAAEWITEGEAEVRVLAPVHDSAQRKYLPARQIGYFDATRTIDEGTGSYDEANLGSQSHIEPDFRGVVGSLSADGSTLTLHDPATKSEGLLTETLIHEVLHDADQHDNGAWSEGVAGGLSHSSIYDAYTTEFRAYWFENAEGSTSDNFESSSGTNVGHHTVNALNGTGVLETASTSFKNRRQESIWLHLRGRDRPAGDWLDAAGNWAHPYAYLGHHYVLDPAFRKMVDDYDRPRDGNAVASVRIQRLSEAIGISCGEIDMEAVLAAAADLDALDRTWLADQQASRPFWEQARDTLDLRGSRALRTAVMGDATSAATTEEQRYTVVAGDTLGLIADRMLGATARWEEIYDMNASVIGSNPDLLEPGQRLALPDA